MKHFNLSNNDQNIDFFEAFVEEFDNVNDMIDIAITGSDVFSPECLKAVRRTTK